MAIDFPNNPTNGSTYSYQGVTHTFIASPAPGYWTVITHGNVGVATTEEINIGTDPAKYIAPFNLNESKYIREQESGVTNLTFNGLDKAVTSGTGLTVLGDIIADNIGSGTKGTGVDASTGFTMYWRKSQDDFIQQWGQTKTIAAGGAGRKVLTFPTAFTDVESISVLLTQNQARYWSYGNECYAHTIRTVDCILERSAHDGGAASNFVSWYACGY